MGVSLRGRNKGRMEDAKFDIWSRKYECHIELRERVTVIIGDSGVGKTVFAAVQNRANVYKIVISHTT